eukprot:gene16908-8092_t
MEGDIRDLLSGQTLSAVALQELPWAAFSAGRWCTVNESDPTAVHAGPLAPLSGIDIELMRKIATAGRFR